MKLLKLALVSSLLIGGIQSAKASQPTAEDCATSAIVSTYLMFTITSAPTGSTLMSSIAAECHSDAALNLKQEVISYKMSGEVGPIMKATAERLQRETSLDEEQRKEENIIRHITNSVM